MEAKYLSNSDIKDLKQSIDRDVNSYLSLLDTETGEVTELEYFDYLIEAPLFRTGSEIIYNSRGRIYSYKIREKLIEEIDTGYCIYCNNDHVLSPDGTRIAVSHFTQEDMASRIYIIDLENSNVPFLVTPHAPSYLHGWSPDGKMLAYCALRNGKYDIYSIPAEGGVEVQLTDGLGRNDGSEYSADGTYIYFNSVRNGFMDCYRMYVDGSQQIRLTKNGRNNWFPHISPDLEKIVYISYDAAEVEPDDHPANKQVEIHLMNADGTNDRVLLKLLGGQGTINVNSWDPGSRFVAFVRYTLKE